MKIRKCSFLIPPHDERHEQFLAILFSPAPRKEKLEKAITTHRMEFTKLRCQVKSRFAPYLHSLDHRVRSDINYLVDE